MTRNGILIDLTLDEDAPIVIRNGRETGVLHSMPLRKAANEPIVILDDDEALPNRSNDDAINELTTIFSDACVDYIKETLFSCDWSVERASAAILDRNGDYPKRKKGEKRKRESED